MIIISSYTLYLPIIVVVLFFYMRKAHFFSAILLLNSFLSCQLIHAKQDPKNEPNYLSGELLVKFKPNALANANGLKSAKNIALDMALKQIGAHDIRLVTESKWNGLKSAQGQSFPQIHKVSFDTAFPVADATTLLKRLDCVELVAPNYRYQLAALPKAPENNAFYGIQNNVDPTNIKALWKVPVKNSKRPVIAIVDTGVDSEHPDLKDNMWKNDAEADGLPGVDDDGNGFVDDVYGYNFAFNSPDITDTEGHGSHCAGIAAAVNNNIGVVGMNPDALIMGLRVFDNDGEMTTEMLLSAVDYAVKNGADIINMSLGSYSYSELEEDCMKEASKHCLLVASAGNYGLSSSDSPFFPAAFSCVLGVESSDEELNYDPDGPYFNLNGFGYQTKAPGSSICSTSKGSYKTMSGTSMAAPCVAGIASRLIQCKDYANWQVLKNDIINASSDGCIDAYKAYLGVDYTKPKVELGDYRYEVKKSEEGDVLYYIYPTVQNIACDVDNVVVSVPGVIVSPSSQKIEHINAGCVAELPEPFVITYRNNGIHSDDLLRCSISLKTNGGLASSNKLVFEVPDSLKNYEKSSGNIVWEGIYSFNKKFVLQQKDTLFIRPGAKIAINPDAVFINHGTIIAKGEVDNRICMSGNILCFTSGSVIENVDFSGFVNGCFIDCHLKDCSFKNIDCFGALAINSVFEHCNIVSVNSHYLEEGCRFYNCNLFLNKAIVSVNYFLNPAHLFNCNVFNNKFIEYNANLSLTYSSNNADTVAMGAPCYLGDEQFTPIEERVLDAENPLFSAGNGVVDISNRLTQPTAEAPTFAYKVFADGTDLLSSTTDEFQLPYYIENFEVHFNNAMDVSKLPTFAINCEVTNAQWVNDYLYKATVVIKDKTELYEEPLLGRFFDAEGNEIDTYTDLKTYKGMPAGSDQLGFKGRYKTGQVILTWKTGNEEVLGYNLYRCSEEDFLSHSTKIIQTLLPASQNSFIDKIPSSVNEESFVYRLTKVLKNGTELQAYNWVCVRYSNTVYDENLDEDAIEDSQTDCDVEYNLNGILDYIDMLGQDLSDVEYPCYDLNGDNSFDVLDMVLYMNNLFESQPDQVPSVQASYFIKDSMLYINTPIDLPALQVQFSSVASNFKYMEVLNDMEHAIDNLGNDEYRLVAYSCNGFSVPKGVHPLLKLSDTLLVDKVVLSNAAGLPLDVCYKELEDGEEPIRPVDECQVRYFTFLGKEVTVETVKLVPGSYIVAAYKDGKVIYSTKISTIK